MLWSYRSPITSLKPGLLRIWRPHPFRTDSGTLTGPRWFRRRAKILFIEKHFSNLAPLTSFAWVRHRKDGVVALSAQNIFITLDKFGSFTIGRHIIDAIKLDIIFCEVPFWVRLKGAIFISNMNIASFESPGSTRFTMRPPTGLSSITCKRRK